MGYIQARAAAEALVEHVAYLSEGEIFQFIPSRCEKLFSGVKYGKIITSPTSPYSSAEVIDEFGKRHSLKEYVLPLPKILQKIIQREVSCFNEEISND
jgi:hypothetical protein